MKCNWKKKKKNQLQEGCNESSNSKSLVLRYGSNNHGSASTICTNKCYINGKLIKIIKHEKSDLASEKKVAMVGDQIIKYTRGHEDLSSKQRMVKIIMYSVSTTEDILN